MDNDKSIVVFFSHAGENYSVGDIKEGNTRIIADMIIEQTGADSLEILCCKDYDISYSALCDLAKEEQRKGELPAFTLKLNGKEAEGGISFQEYSTIFVGGPVWWGTYPQVMFSFLKAYDLSGKTLLPFTTHEGSGLGSCMRDIRDTCPKATFGKPFSIYGHDVRSKGKEEINKWIKELK